MPLDLAVEFCRQLRGYLTVEQMATIIRRNRSEENPHVCHSHDFCDANQFMLDALAEFGIGYCGGEDTPEAEKQAALINRAWDIAAVAEFDYDRCTTEAVPVGPWVIVMQGTLEPDLTAYDAFQVYWTEEQARVAIARFEHDGIWFGRDCVPLDRIKH